MQRLFAILSLLLLLTVAAHAQPWAGGAEPVQGVGDTGTPRGKVLTVQGITGGTPIVVDCDNCTGGSSDSITGGGTTLTASATGLDGDVPAGGTVAIGDGTTEWIAVDANGAITLTPTSGQVMTVGSGTAGDDAEVVLNSGDDPGDFPILRFNEGGTTRVLVSVDNNNQLIFQQGGSGVADLAIGDTIVTINNVLDLTPRSAAPSGSQGVIYVDSDSATLCWHNGTSFQAIDGAGPCE